MVAEQCPAGTTTAPASRSASRAQLAAVPTTAASTPAASAEHAELDQPGGADLRPAWRPGFSGSPPRASAAAAPRRPRRPAPARRRPASAARWRPARRPIWPSRSATARSTSATRMPVTFGSASVTARSIAGVRRRRRRGRWRCAVCGACDSRPGAGDHGEVERQRAPRDVAQVGDLQVDVAAQHVDPDACRRPPRPSPSPGRRRTRPAAGRRSRPATSARRQPRARRGIVPAIGQAAVAAQRPGRAGRRPAPASTGTPFTATMRARSHGTVWMSCDPRLAPPARCGSGRAGRSGCR